MEVQLRALKENYARRPTNHQPTDELEGSYGRYTSNKFSIIFRPYKLWQILDWVDEGSAVITDLDMDNTGDNIYVYLFICKFIYLASSPELKLR